MRIRPIWHAEGKYKGAVAYQYGVQFAAAKAEDLERIRRWITGQPIERTNAAQEDLAPIRLRQEDVDRLIPVAFQRVILQELVDRGRLAPFTDVGPALVGYDYGGRVRYQGKQMHRLTIQSKVVVRGEDEADRYSTRVLFDGLGNFMVLDGKKPKPATAAIG
jgi:hypothetical protein